MKTSLFRTRVFGFLSKRPSVSYTIAELERELKDVKRPMINYWLQEFIKDGTVIKPKYGHYQINPKPPDIEAIRELALEAGKKKIISTDRLWQPGEEALQLHTQHPALPSRRLHFLSILQRMSSSPAFSQFDVELLKMELPALAKGEEIVKTS